MTTNHQPTLVLGATGKTGRRVAARLAEMGEPVRAASRSGETPFDWQRPEGWEPALTGVRAAYVTYYPDIAAPGGVEAVSSFAQLAVDTGVRRLVLLSGRGEPEAEEAEEAVRQTGADLTIVRSTWFAQNFSEDFMTEHVLRGVVSLPGGDTPEPFVDLEDVAEIAVAALTDDRHIGELYELTGPRLLTFADATAEIARAAGRDIRYEPASIEDYAKQEIDAGTPAEFVDALVYLFSTVLDGRNAHVTDGVHRALGRGPRDFAEYARRAAGTGVWDV